MQAASSPRPRDPAAAPPHYPHSSPDAPSAPCGTPLSSAGAWVWCVSLLMFCACWCMCIDGFSLALAGAAPSQTVTDAKKGALVFTNANSATTARHLFREAPVPGGRRGNTELRGSLGRRGWAWGSANVDSRESVSLLDTALEPN
eukprot:scaffold7831_cov95-Phaeocystis_antarctica.AAC.6